MDRPFIASVEIPGPFEVLTRQIWIKPESRRPPTTGEAIVPKAVQASSDPDAKAANLINRSGLNDRDLDGLDEHSGSMDHMWLSAKGQTEGWLEFDLGESQPVSMICIWNYNDTWRTDRGVRKADISIWTQEKGWQKLRDDLLLERAEGGDDYDEATIVSLDAVQAQKVRLDDLENFGDVDRIGLSEVQFFRPRGPEAVRPYPIAGAQGIGGSGLTLQWQPGSDAVAHDIYVGHDPANLKLLGRVEGAGQATLSPLAADTKYYWRIDEIQEDDTVATGTAWSFTTGGLVGWWKLDESEGKDAADASENNHTGRLIGGAKWQPDGGRLGGALELDGNGGFVDLGNNPVFNCTDEVTIAAWVKVSELNKVWQTIVAKGDTTWRLSRNLSTNATHLGIGYPTDMHLVEGRVGVSDGQWHHIAGVYDGRRISLYVDGKLDLSTYASGKIPANEYPLYIGENSETRGRYWNGLIDDVRLYNCALAPGQIQALARGETPPPVVREVSLVSPGDERGTGPVRLVGWWKFDEADGTEAADSSGNNAPGALVGDAQWQPDGGKIGGAVKLDGEGDYVEIGNEAAFDITDAITVAAWLKVDQFDKEWQSVVTKGDSAWRLHRTRTERALTFHGAGIGPDQWGGGVEGTRPVDDGEWHHAAATYDGSTVALYIDGKLDRSAEIPGRIQTNDHPVLIGENSQRAGREWNGLIDEVCIFACALDTDAVDALYSGKNPITIAKESRPLTPAGAEPPLRMVADSGAAEPQRRSRNWLAVVAIIAAVGVIAGVSMMGRKKPTARS